MSRLQAQRGRVGPIAQTDTPQGGRFLRRSEAEAEVGGLVSDRIMRRISACGAHKLICMSRTHHIALTSAQRRRLERIAEERHVPVGALVRDAIDLYIASSCLSPRQAADCLFALEAPTAEWAVMKEGIQREAIA